MDLQERYLFAPRLFPVSAHYRSRDKETTTTAKALQPGRIIEGQPGKSVTKCTNNYEED